MWSTAQNTYCFMRAHLAAWNMHVPTVCMGVFVCMSENECKRQSELKTNLYFQLNPFLKTENNFFFVGGGFDSS